MRQALTKNQIVHNMHFTLLNISHILISQNLASIARKVALTKCGLGIRGFIIFTDLKQQITSKNCYFKPKLCIKYPFWHSRF